MNSQALRRFDSSTLWTGLILVAAAIIFGSLFRATPLAWDDDLNIFGNPHYLTSDWMFFWRQSYGGLFVPLASIVWGALFHLGGGSATPFHAFNLILHLLNIFLLLKLLQGLSTRWHFSSFAIAIAVAVFALHPLQVEAVAWLSGGRDLLATTFALLAIGAFFTRKGNSGFALSTALFLSAMLCKPSAAVLPFAVGLLHWLLHPQPHHSRFVTLQMTIWTMLAIAVGWITYLGQTAPTVTEISLWPRILIAFDSFDFYLQKFIFPYPLSANYARTPLAAISDRDLVWSAITAFAVLAGFLFLSWRRDRRYALITIWFVAILPVSGIVSFDFQKISTVADHYNYLPMAALSLTLAFLLSRFSWEGWPRFVPHALVAILVGTYSFVSYARAQVWMNDESFFTDMAKHSPDSYATALGMSIVACEDQHQYEEGVRWTEVALRAQPLDVLALANQAYCFLNAKNYFRVIELEYYLGQMDLEKLEHEQPTAYASLLASIGSAYLEQQQYADGFQFLCEAYRVKPEDPQHAQNLELGAEILRKHNIEPTCETVTEEDGELPNEEPIQEIWPTPIEEEEKVVPDNDN